MIRTTGAAFLALIICAEFSPALGEEGSPELTEPPSIYVLLK